MTNCVGKVLSIQKPSFRFLFDSDYLLMLFEQDGHYWFESNSVDQVQPMEDTALANLHFHPPTR